MDACMIANFSTPMLGFANPRIKKENTIGLSMKMGLNWAGKMGNVSTKSKWTVGGDFSFIAPIVYAYATLKVRNPTGTGPYKPMSPMSA